MNCGKGLQPADRRHPKRDPPLPKNAEDGAIVAEMHMQDWTNADRLEVEASAAKGDSAAQMQMSMLFLHGLAGVEVDHERAFQWCLKSAEQGYAEGQALLGTFILEGTGTAKDPSSAAIWLRKAADNGSVISEYTLSILHFEGLGVDQSIPKAISLLRSAAKKGLDEAQVALGDSYYYGDGLPMDYAKAFGWYRKAARQEHPEGQFKLFRMYRLGEGTRKDLRRAYSQLRKLAVQPDPEFTYYLGDMELAGLGTKRNPRLGVMHVREAAEQGYATAQLRLGMMRFDGESFPKDLEESYAWTRKAAEQDEVGALIRLSWLHYAGHGVERNAGQGAEWFGRFTSLPHEHFRAVMLEQMDGFVERFEVDELFETDRQPMQEAVISYMFLYSECDRLNLNIFNEALNWTYEIGEHGNGHAENMIILHKAIFDSPAADMDARPDDAFGTSHRRARVSYRNDAASELQRKG